MKRFFCTKCQKVKRVRSLPKKIEGLDKLDPSLRLSKCEYHNHDSHNSYLNSINPRVHNTRIKPVKVIIDTPARKRRA